MLKKNDLKKHFSISADVWDTKIYKKREKQGVFEYFDKQYRLDYTEKMIPHSNSLSGKAIDVGCGAGQFLPILVNKGYKTYGIDFSSEMIELSKQRCRKEDMKVTLHMDDAVNLSFPNNYFDVYIGMGVIEYMNSDEPMLKEIRRVLKPGGVAIITLRNMLSIHVTWNMFYVTTVNPICKNAINKILKKKPFSYTPISRRHDPQEIKRKLKSLDFEFVDERYCHFHTLPIPLSGRLFPIQAVCGKIMEKYFCKGVFPRLASTYIVKFRKPSE